MKGKWYVNWLVVITLVLLFSSLGTFALSLRDTIGIKKCAYGDNLNENCICNSKGEVICEDEALESVTSSEFSSSKMINTYDFLSFFDVNSSNKSVKFVNISLLNSNLNVTLELASYCNQQGEPAKQAGFYKVEKDRLTLTTATNLIDESFNRACIVESMYCIKEFDIELGDFFEIVYQDEFGSIYPANNCVYDQFLRNDGDVYNSVDGCYICHCTDGENICEEQDSCL